MELFADVVPKTAENMRCASYIRVLVFITRKIQFMWTNWSCLMHKINIEGPIAVYYSKKKLVQTSCY